MLSGHVHLGKKESQSEISDFYILCLKESQNVMQRAREKRRGGGEGRGGEGRGGERTGEERKGKEKRGEGSMQTSSGLIAFMKLTRILNKIFKISIRFLSLPILRFSKRRSPGKFSVSSPGKVL